MDIKATLPQYTMLYSSSNFVILYEPITRLKWLYSHNKAVCYYNMSDGKIMINKGLTERQTRHVEVFRNKLKNNEI